MSAAAEVERIRTGMGLFRLPGRGVIAVSGADRVRWLNGMLSNDVAELERRGPGSGCYALLLTPQGRVVADLHLLYREEAVWLETERAVIAEVLARLERYVIADDVVLTDRSRDLARLGLEGPAVLRVLEALGVGPPDPEGWVEAGLAGEPTVIARYAFAGGDGLQLFVPAQAEEAVLEAVELAGADLGLVAAAAPILEVLRVEAGVPWLGRDLDESVLPDEARLEHAASTTKGCYTGQEVVARMRSRGRLGHRLVGLRFDTDAPPEPGVEVTIGERRVGEVTSAVVSPTQGAIALAYVRLPHDVPGTGVEAAGFPGRVSELPFVRPV